MQSEDPVWHFTQGHERGGPVDWPTLVGLARSGAIDPRADMVWKPGMGDWEPAGQVDGLFEKRAVTPEESAYVELSPEVMPERDRPREIPVSSGVGRTEYLLGCLFLVPAMVIGGGWVLKYFRDDLPVWVEKWGALGLVVLGVWLVIRLTVLRLRNVGMTGWWLLALLVPFLNLWVKWRCLAAPPGYTVVKRLDGPGWVLSALYWLSVAGGLAVGGIVLWTSWQTLEEEGGLEELMRKAKENYETMDVRHKSQ